METFKNIDWKSDRKKISDLCPAPYNPRKLSEKQSADLNKSLTKFNLADPIVINTNNRIIGGHQRIAILKTKNVDEVDVRIPSRELTEAEEKELNLRLNKNLGEWDFDLLGAFDEALLKDVGFDTKELDKIFTAEPSGNDDDAPQPRKETDIKRGDIFTLGRHRIMCGDSTDGGDVAILMDGKKADMVFTSPPYNLGKNIALRGNDNVLLAKKRNAYEKYDDEKTSDDYLSFLNRALTICLDTAVYVFLNVQLLAGNNNVLLRSIAESSEFLCDLAIWDKGKCAPAMAKKVMNSCFEMIFIFAKENPSRMIRIAPDFGGTIDNIFRLPGQKQNEFSKIHGATFPVVLPETFINTFSHRESVIFDPFLGTGSTLIACEKTNRVCYGMEIDPIYCQVIIDRWEDFAGKKAEQVNG